MRCRVLVAYSCPLTKMTALRSLRWFGQVLRMRDPRPSLHALFARAGQDWNERCCGQAMTRCRGVEKLASASASVGASRLRGWSQRDEGCYSL